jgi:hypothetical protein
MFLYYACGEGAVGMPASQAPADLTNSFNKTQENLSGAERRRGPDEIDHGAIARGT